MFLAALAAVQGWREEIDGQLAYGELELTAIAARNEELYAQGKMKMSDYAGMCDQVAVARQRHSERYYELTVHADWKKYAWLQPAFGPNTNFADEYEPWRLAYDLAYQFREEDARTIAAPTQQHAATGFAMLIGAGARTIPDLSMIQAESLPRRLEVLLLDFPGINDLLDQVIEKNPLCFPNNAFDQELFEIICASDMVVGPRSAATYLAAALEKRLVELDTSSDYRSWLAKWDSPNYTVIYGESTTEMILQAMKNLWSRPLEVHTQAEPNVMKTRTHLHGMPVGTGAPHWKINLPEGVRK
jgi:hypothetical protein